MKCQKSKIFEHVRKLRFPTKRGQGINAAVLVAIIAGLIIIYLLFLPADELEPYLDGAGGDDNGDSGGSGDAIVLLEENIGRLDPAAKVDDKDIPNVYLFETTESKELDKFNPIYVRNGVFDKKDKTIEFSLDELENTEDVMLSFSTPIRSGILSIGLNGEVIYESAVTSLNPNPVSIQKKYLSENNQLSFSVSGVGWMFWKTNEYQIDNIRLIGDITDKTRQEAQNVFTMTDNEYQNLESAELRFIPYCGAASQIGKLDIEVNNRNIFSAVPVCDDPYSQAVPISVLSGGANKVLFKTSKGSYSIEQIKMKLRSKDTIKTVYYFEVNDTVYEDIFGDDRDPERQVKMRISFVDDDDKRADININDHVYRYDDDDKEYVRDITTWIEEGNNFIEITPKTRLDIVDVLIEVEEE